MLSSIALSLELQAADIFTKTFESGVKWATLLPLINVTLPSDFWSLVQSHCSVFVAAAVQLVNFPWGRRALDYSIPNDCVWEGDIVFDLTRPSHWDTHIPPLERGRGCRQYSGIIDDPIYCLLYTSPSPRDRQKYRMPSSA